MPNQAADAWAAAQSTARALVSETSPGDSIDTDDLGEMVTDEVRKELRARDLYLDDDGRVQARCPNCASCERPRRASIGDDGDTLLTCPECEHDVRVVGSARYWHECG